MPSRLPPGIEYTPESLFQINDVLVKQITEDRYSYPLVKKFNTLKKIEARQERVKELLRVKKGKIQYRRMNEYLILIGKSMAIQMKHSEQSKKRRQQIDRADEERQDILMVSKYLHAGQIILEISRNDMCDGNA
jgi:hypothetical protein